MSQDTLDYVELLPPPALRRFVKFIWRVRGPASQSAAPQPVIPDGCVEVILNCADPFRRHHDGGVEIQPSRLVAGQLTGAVTIAPTGVVDLWGIRFHPWGAAAFLGVPGSELRDRMLPLDAIPSVDALLARTFNGTSDDARAELLFDALTERVRRVRPLDATLPALAKLAVEGSVASVKGLSILAGVSVRRVQSLFAEHVGLSPKALMRLARFQRAIALTRRDPAISLARVAAECGYFDHAHLVRDARAIVGLTPSALGDMGPITSLFITAPAATTRAL
jgi:AraC-like DNA-binding protein